MNVESTQLYSTWGLPGVVVFALAVVLLTALLAHVIVHVVRKMLKRTTDGEVGGSIIANILRVAIWALGASLVLQACLGMNPSVIFGALGIGGIALSLGLQNTVSNLIGGLQLSLSRDVAVGNWVVIGSNAPAKVVDINWRIVRLVDENGVRFLVPNSVINSTTVQVLPEPYTLLFAVSLASDIDLDVVKPELVRIAHDALKAHDMCFEDKEPLVSITGSTVDSVSAQIKVYARRDFTQIQINNVVMPPVFAYLQSIGGMAHCYSGTDDEN